MDDALYVSLIELLETRLDNFEPSI